MNLTNVVLATAATVVIAAVMHTVQVIFAGPQAWHQALSFTGDWSLPAFLTAGLLLFAAGASARAASERRHERAGWLALAALMVAFAADDLFELHDRVEAVGDLETPLLVLAVLAGPAVAVILWRPLSRLERPAPQFLLAAAATLAISQAAAFVWELTGTEAYAEGIGKSRHILVLIEECGEILVAGFVLAAAVGALQLRGDGNAGSDSGDRRSGACACPSIGSKRAPPSRT